MKDNLSCDTAGVGRKDGGGSGGEAEDVKKKRERRETTRVRSGEKGSLFCGCACVWRSGFLFFPPLSLFFSRRTSGVKQDTGREAPSWQVDSLIPVTLNYVGNLHRGAQSRAERDSHMPRKPAYIFFFFFSFFTPHPPHRRRHRHHHLRDTDSCSGLRLQEQLLHLTSVNL